VLNNLFSGNLGVYEIVWKKFGKAGPAAGDNIIRRLRFACWLTKTADAHSDCVILIAIPSQ